MIQNDVQTHQQRRLFSLHADQFLRTLFEFNFALFWFVYLREVERFLSTYWIQPEPSPGGSLVRSNLTSKPRYGNSYMAKWLEDLSKIVMWQVKSYFSPHLSKTCSVCLFFLMMLLPMCDLSASMTQTWTSGKTFSLWEWLSAGTGCPGRLWSRHP